MNEPRFLARGLLVSFLLIALLATPGALSFTWAGAAAVDQAGARTPTETGTPSNKATATSTVLSLGKFTRLQAAPLGLPMPHIVISEFRSQGPSSNGHQTDEFIELFNPSPSATIDLTGWTLWESAGCAASAALFYTLGPVSLMPGMHFLIAGQNYSGVVSPDVTTTIAIADDGGLALIDTTPAVVDAVGMCSTTTYFETVPLLPLSGNFNQSYDRKADGSGACVDTDNNAADFFLRNPSDPQNSHSPVTLCGNATPTPIPPATVTISGTVGAAGGGATLTYTGGSTTANTVTGMYSFTVPYNWTGTVRPSKPGYSFTPDHIDYSIPITADQLAQNYIATLITFRISGNAGIADATLNYAGGPATADGTGNYHLDVPSGWTGTVTPSKAGYVFAPTSRPYNNVTADRGSQDYTATASCSAAPLQVLINEIGWGGTLASSSDEWVELYNPNSTCSVNLDAWSLVGVSNGGVTQFNIVFTSATGDVIPAGGYFVIVRNDGTFQNVPQSPQTKLKTATHLSLVDAGEILYLYGPSPAQVRVDTANLYGTTSTTVGAVGPWPAGLSAGRSSMERYGVIPDATDAWATFGGPVDPTGRPLDRNTNVVHGTPGLENWAVHNPATAVPPTPKVRKPTPIPPTPFAHMLINEFLPRAGTDWNHDGAINLYDEFIEVKNLGPLSVDLKGWKLDDAANPLHSYTLPSMTLKTGERALFYRSTTNIPQEDGGGTVRLINPFGLIFDARGYGPVSKPDVSHCRIPDGYYWQDACFPTPGTENSLTGVAAISAPIPAVLPPPCLLPDTAPESFRLGECAPYGSDIWNRRYWDDQAGNLEFLIKDLFSKWKTIVQ